MIVSIQVSTEFSGFGKRTQAKSHMCVPLSNAGFSWTVLLCKAS